jgi:ubiquinone/menaquinone biosynthesis C-methylase UbiE
LSVRRADLTCPRKRRQQGWCILTKKQQEAKMTRSQSGRNGAAVDYAGAATWFPNRIARLGYPAAYRRLLTEVLETQSVQGLRVADVGAGSGAFSAAFLDAAGAPAELALVDPSVEMLAAAQANLAGRAPLRLHCTGLKDLAADAVFDIVLAAHVVEHFPDALPAFVHIRRLLRPGGRLIAVISRPHWCQWPIWLRWRHRWYAPGVVASMLATAGFDPVRILPLTGGPPARTSLAYLTTRST